MNKKISLLLVAIIFFLIGGGVGYYLGDYYASKKYEEKIKKAVEKLPTSGLVRKTADEIFELNGKIKSIDKENNKIFVSVEPSPNPLEDWPLERELIITSQTKFYQRIVKDFQVYEKEKKDFAAGKIKDYPLPYFEKEINFQDLYEQDYIVFKAKENIKFSKTIQVELILKL